MDNATALRKIRACLRLAGSSNANEAAAALRQAKSLMAQYGISADEADPGAICESVAKTRHRGGDIHHRTWLLGAICGDLFHCFVYIHRRVGDSTTLRFVGVRPNPELAEYAFTVLRRQLERDVAQHIKRVRKASNRRQRAAAYGEAWVSGLFAKLGGKLTGLPDTDRESYKAFAQRQDGLKIEAQERQAAKSNDRDFDAGYRAGSSAVLNHGVQGGMKPLLEAH